MIVVYRDSVGNSVFVQSETDGTLGAFFNNELHAVGNGDGTITVSNRARSGLESSPGFIEISNRPFADFVDQSEASLGVSEVATVNALNAIFNDAGSAGVAPVITSATTVAVTAGDTINYELVADYGVGYEWSGLPAGLVTVDGNHRKLVGGSALVAGTYAVTATAVNYFGEDSETISFVVSSPPYSNTKSVHFSNGEYMQATASLLAGALGRTGNGAGASDAWSIAMWFKPSAAVQGQTVFYFGDSDVTNGGYIQVMQLNNGGAKALRLRYGSNNNCLRMQTTYGSITSGQWHHVLITYDGGTTGASSADMADYYGRFKVYVDGVVQTRSDSHVNYGYTASVDADNCRMGRFASGNYMRDCRVDEFAVWDSDQSGNVADIYNSGATHDLSLLTNPPLNYWRMGDGDTFPTIEDQIGTADFTMLNMVASDIVTDSP